MPDISEGTYVFDGVSSVYPNGGRIYVANAETGEIGCYTFADFMAYTPIYRDAPPTQAMYADNSALFLYGEGTVTEIRFAAPEEGASDDAVEIEGVSSWEVADFFDIPLEWVSICANDDEIFLVNEMLYSPTEQEDHFITIDRRTGEGNVQFSDDLSLGNIGCIRPDGKDFILIGYADNDYSFRTVCRYDMESQRLEKLYSFVNYPPCDYVDGEVYCCRRFVGHQLLHVTDHGENMDVMRSVNEGNRSFSSMFYTGWDFLLWSKYDSTLCVYNAEASESGQTLNVLYPITVSALSDRGADVGYVSYDMMRFEEENDCSVRGSFYPAGEYPDRLCMKLLAGDEDMDVIYLDYCNAGDLFAAILRYGLYLPLEDCQSVVENFGQFADGVQELMTYDGHLIGVPLRFDADGFMVTEAYEKLGLPIPGKNWTIDDFWTLCEAALPVVDEVTALTPSYALYWMFETLIENGVREGKFDASALTETAEKLKFYYDAGVIIPFNAGVSFMLDDRLDIAGRPGNMSSLSRDYITEVLPRPTIAGKRYADLNSFVFGYRETQNRELTEKYLTMQTTEEFRAMLVCDGYFLKNSDAYYILEPDEMEKIPIEVPEKDRYVLSEMSELLPGTALHTTATWNDWETLADILGRLYSGALSPVETADEVENFARYRYLE